MDRWKNASGRDSSEELHRPLESFWFTRKQLLVKEAMVKFHKDQTETTASSMR